MIWESKVVDLLRIVDIFGIISKFIPFELKNITKIHTSKVIIREFTAISWTSNMACILLLHLLNPHPHPQRLGALEEYKHRIKTIRSFRRRILKKHSLRLGAL